MSERIRELRIENQKLKKNVEELETKILSLVGNIEIEISQKGRLNKDILELFTNTEQKLSILAQYIDRFYTNELKRLSEKGIKVMVVMHDRGLIPKKYKSFYDELKSASNIQTVTNPNIKCLIIFNEKKGIYSGGTLAKSILDNSILVETKINETSKLSKIKQIYNLFLPSFMRK
jgi:hypothetical protein